jgi:hypothetical protein
MTRSKPSTKITIAGTILIACCFGAGAQQLPPGGDPQPTSGLDAILSLRNQYAVVGIGEFHGCQEIYNFLAALLKDGRFPSAFNDIVVDFGNLRYQNLVDAYVGGGDIPFNTLRQVWQNTTDVGLWDSPLYAEFYDTVREVNAMLPPGQRLRVILGGAPVIWSSIRTVEDFQTAAGTHEQSLASAINDSIGQGHHALVVAGAAHLFRKAAGFANARSLVEARNPNQIAVVLAQSRFGGDLYTQVESAEAAWPLNSIASISGTWLGAGRPTAPILRTHSRIRWMLCCIRVRARLLQPCARGHGSTVTGNIGRNFTVAGSWRTGDRLRPKGLSSTLAEGWPTS